MGSDETPPAPESPPESPTVPTPVDRRTADIWLVLAIVLLPGLVNDYTQVLWPETRCPGPTVGSHQWNLMAMLTGWAALILFLISRGDHPFSHYGIVRPNWRWDWLLVFIVISGAWWVSGLVVRSFPDTSSLAVAIYPPPPANAWELLLTGVGCLAVGFTEELVWRSYLFTRIQEVTGSAIKGLIITSTLFGLGHLYQGLTGVVSAAMVGFAFCSLYWAIRRIWPLAMGHGMYNFILFTMD